MGFRASSVINRTCPKCQRSFPASKAFFFQEGPGKLCAWCKECKIASRSSPSDKEKHRQYCLEYYQRNKERLKDARRIYYSRHRLEQAKKRRTTPELRYVMYRRNADRVGHDFSISFQDFLSFWTKPCSYCRSPIENIGLDRVDSALGYSSQNVVACCFPCNKMKGTLKREAFISQCKLVAQNG